MLVNLIITSLTLCLGKDSSSINAAISPKHRLLLKVIYSAGLRKSEIINLKIEHLDFKNHRIYIKPALCNRISKMRRKY